VIAVACNAQLTTVSVRYPRHDRKAQTPALLNGFRAARIAVRLRQVERQGEWLALARDGYLDRVLA
jgi:hypothetical protein